MSNKQNDEDYQIQQCNKIIESLQKQVIHLSNNNRDQNPEEMIEFRKDKQMIYELQRDNKELSLKLRELLSEMIAMESRFQEQKLIIVGENHSFRSAANEEILRLKDIIMRIEEQKQEFIKIKNQQRIQYQTQKYQNNQNHQNKNQTIVIAANSGDPRVKISGGYEQFAKARGSTPVKVRVTTTQTIGGVKTISVQEAAQYLQFVDKKE